MIYRMHFAISGDGKILREKDYTEKEYDDLWNDRHPSQNLLPDGGSERLDGIWAKWYKVQIEVDV